MKTPTNKVAIVALLLALGLGTRLFIAWYHQDSFWQRGNRYTLINPIAHNLWHNGEFSFTPGVATASQEPLYPLVVAASYGLFEKEWLGLALVQSFLSLGNALLVLWLASKFSWRTGLLATTLFLLYPFYVYQTISVSDTTLFTLLLAAATCVTWQAKKQDSARTSLVAGSLWGLALLTRGSTLAFLPALIWYTAKGRSLKESLFWHNSCALLLGILLIISPWCLRNFLHSQKIFLSTHGAIEIWFAYNPETASILQNNLSVDLMKKNLPQKLPSLKQIRANHPRFSIERDLAQSSVFIQAAWQYLGQHPYEVLTTYPWKFWRFWSCFLSPVPQSQFWLRQTVYFCSYVPILLAAIAGVFLLYRQPTSHHSEILLALIVAYTLFHTLLFGFTRLRVPLDQFLIVYAAYAVTWIIPHTKTWITNQ